MAKGGAGRLSRGLHCALPHCKPEFFWSSFSARAFLRSFFGITIPDAAVALALPLFLCLSLLIDYECKAVGVGEVVLAADVFVSIFISSSPSPSPISTLLCRLSLASVSSLTRH